MLIDFTIDEFRNDPTVRDKVFNLLAPNFPVSMRKLSIIDEIIYYLSNYRGELHVIVEDKYIDKVYRNTFSNYYSTKLNAYPEYCLRLSFLEPNAGFNTMEDIPNAYLGFMILRPIYPGVVGRTSINPKALVNNGDMLVCKSKIRASVLGIKTYVEAFPHSSQDNEYSTCAETSIWSLMEYFGNKYPEYSPILPSKIHGILDKKAYERHVPSIGLTYYDISYVLKYCGFGTKNYYRFRSTDPATDQRNYMKLRRIFSTYIESGIPIGVAISSQTNDPFGHAVVCVGRKKIDRDKITTAPKYTKNGKNFHRWCDVPEEFIFNDDNVGAYQLTHFDKPAPQSGRNDLYISNIIVPLYSKIYLDAPSAMFLSEEFCTNKLPLKDNTVFRTFLASSNSYINHIMLDPLIDEKYKAFILYYIKLPKFIWVTEISDVDNFKANTVEGLLILDATEPYKKEPVHPLFATYEKNIYFYDNATNVYRVNTLTTEFKNRPFNNLT